MAGQVSPTGLFHLSANSEGNMIKKLVNVALFQIFGQALMFLRNMIVGRHVGVYEYGISLEILLVITIVEAISDIGIEQYVITAKDGHVERVVGNLHFLSLARGFAISVALLFSMYMVNNYFPFDIWWGVFIFPCIYSLIRSAACLDTKVQQRNLNYHRDQSVFLISQLASILACIILIPISSDRYMMAFVLLIQSASYTISSHVLSKRTYLVNINRNIIASILKFGMSFTIASFANLISAQSDRIVVASIFGAYILGKYGAASAVVIAVGLLIQRIMNITYLPILSIDNVKSVKVFIIYNCIISFFIFSFLGIFGDKIISILFGSSYRLDFSVYVLIASVSAIRLIRGAVNTSLIGVQGVKYVAVGNIIILPGVASATFVAYFSLNLSFFIFILLFSEIISLIISLNKLIMITNRLNSV